MNQNIACEDNLACTYVCVSGNAQHGKDTFSLFCKRYLEEKKNYKVLIFHYGDYLKHICKTMFDWDGKKDIAGRTTLQYIGTDIVRSKDPDFWVDSAIKLFTMFDGTWDFVFIPDCRFPNEIDKLENIFGKNVRSVKIIRTNFDNGLTAEQKEHPSETAMDHYVFNEIPIYNKAGLTELMNDSISFCNKLIDAKEKK